MDCTVEIYLPGSKTERWRSFTAPYAFVSVGDVLHPATWGEHRGPKTRVRVTKVEYVTSGADQKVLVYTEVI
jgi:hypothetical protein